MKRPLILLVLSLIACAIYSASQTGDGILTSGVSARDEIQGILKDEARAAQSRSFVEGRPQGQPSERPSLGEAIQVVMGELDSRGYAVVSTANSSTGEAGSTHFQAAELEGQIDALALAPFEETIFRAFDSSPEGVMLRRIVLSRRHPERIDGGARLEDLYVQDLAQRPDAAVASIEAALRALPKEEFREEHVLLRDLVNRLPGGYERLQAALPDEEFK